METKNAPVLRNAQWVAELFGITCDEVRRKARLGKIPATRIGDRSWRFDEEKILEYLNRKTTGIAA